MSGYGPRTTAGEVVENIDLTGAVTVVTGVGGGLGRETARAFASAGATVVLAARTTDSARRTASRILETVPGARLDVLAVDLADLTSVTAAAAELRDRYREIDVLVNNAGVMYTPEQRTVQGFELQFGTNHLGHFLLTTSLLPALAAGAQRSGTPSRVVAVSSDAHRGYPVDLADPNFLDRPYDKFAAYGQAKAANVLMAMELDERWAARGVGGYAVHPGVCATRLSRYMDGDDLAEMHRLADAAEPGMLENLKSAAAGAATSTWAATAPELRGHGGTYLSDCAIGAAADHATDPDTAAALWELSTALVRGAGAVR